MLQLGMDTEGTELRAKMQSTSLLSDMESFKAANPGSILSDFVRWHSPRDWEEDEVTPERSSRQNYWIHRRNLRPTTVCDLQCHRRCDYKGSRWES